MAMHEPIETDAAKCIKHLSECRRSCWDTINYCLNEGGDHNDPEHIKLLIDCAEICAITENYLERASMFSESLCELCADICEECAASCADFKDEHMDQCTDVCKRCAESCRDMI